MANIKGQNLRVMLGPDVNHLKWVAVAQSCNLHLQAVVGDSSSKDSDNAWEEKEVTALNWDIQVDALVAAPDSDAVNLQNMTIGQTYTIRFVRTGGYPGAHNRDYTTDAIQVTGEAILTDLQVVSGNRQQATWTAKFIGDGDLTQYSQT